MISSEPHNNFNQSLWQANVYSRFDMADDIISNNLLIGKDSKQILDLIGSANHLNSLNNGWTHDLGMSGGLSGFIFHHLIIIFDSKKVVSVSHDRIED